MDTKNIKNNSSRLIMFTQIKAFNLLITTFFFFF